MMKPNERRLDELVVVDAKLDDYATLVGELGRDDVRVNLFASGEDALRANGHGASTLWVVNMRLPDMPGVGFLKLVRRRWRRSSIFLVGDEYSADDELAARSVGATAYVCKPASAAWLAAYQPRCRSPAVRAGPDAGEAARPNVTDPPHFDTFKNFPNRSAS